MFQPLTYLTRQIIIVNVVFFFLGGLLKNVDLHYLLGAHYPTSEHFKIFQVITYAFVHGDIWHLFFNMFGLYIFGPIVERVLGQKKYFILYTVSALGSLALHYLVLTYQFNREGIQGDSLLIGASGALYGVLTAFAVYFPNMPLRLLFPPITLKAKHLVMIYIGFDLFQGFQNSPTNNVANFAHIGGALAGFLLVRNWKKNTFKPF